MYQTQLGILPALPAIPTSLPVVSGQIRTTIGNVGNFIEGLFGAPRPLSSRTVAEVHSLLMMGGYATRIGLGRQIVAEAKRRSGDYSSNLYQVISEVIIPMQIEEYGGIVTEEGIVAPKKYPIVDETVVKKAGIGGTAGLAIAAAIGLAILGG